MGCSLCSLQKREERYKLLYEISQVNGRDLSRASHEEAVEAFRSAKDPVVVQVFRRTPLPRGQGSPQDVQVVDVCTQTEITFEHIMALAKLRPTTPPVPDVCPSLLSDSFHSPHSEDQENFEGSPYLSTLTADVERPEDFEYEEVELCRLNSEDKLGLTLCYRTDDEDDAGIYVSEVEPNSIAACDGRIQEGDRILQINGQYVQDRQEAVAVLSSEECRNIVLLLCRPEVQFVQDETWLDDEHNQFLEELKMEMLEEQRREEEEMERATREEDEKAKRMKANVTASCSYHQGKVTDQRDGSAEGSERNLFTQIQKRLSRCLRQQEETMGQSLVSERCSGEGQDHEVLEGDRYQQLLELKCQIRNSGEYDLFYTRSSTIECSSREECGGVQQELRLLNEELHSIELECQNIIQAHQLCKREQLQQSCRHGQHARKLADISECPEKSDKDSSSAYNTAESSRSTPLTMDQSPEHSLHRMFGLTNQMNLKSSFLARRGSPACLPVRRAPNGSPDHSNPSESDQTPPVDDESSQRRILKSRVHCLSPRQQQIDIPAHTQHYQSYMHLIQQQSTVEYAHSQLSLLGMSGPQAALPSEPKMEWKVKVRSDGTRYITKRPVRDRLLRERALKIKEERSGGMTTDDDNMSEMKMGRYWSKEERKQQLLRAKEQRRRREFMQRSRLECLGENPQSGSEGRKEVSIIELSHRKMMKKRNKKILDNWMTIQELMTHGAKAPEASKVHNTFLSVTTV